MGRERRLEEFRGKVVLVNFWASWCTPCIEEMPSIQRLAELMRDRPFAVIGVNVAEQERRAKAMVQRLGIGFPVLLDRESDVFHRWGGTVLPTTYVLDGDGVVRFVGRGPLEWDAPDVVKTLEHAGATEAADSRPMRTAVAPSRRSPGGLSVRHRAPVCLLLLPLLLLICLGPPAAANDFEAAGLASGLAPVEASRIRLVTERVVLTQTADDWRAEATYVFHNPTAEPIATTFAFPEGCPEVDRDNATGASTRAPSSGTW